MILSTFNTEILVAFADRDKNLIVPFNDNGNHLAFYMSHLSAFLHQIKTSFTLKTLAINKCLGTCHRDESLFQNPDHELQDSSEILDLC